MISEASSVGWGRIKARLVESFEERPERFLGAYSVR